MNWQWRKIDTVTQDAPEPKIEAPDPFDLESLRRDPEEGLVKAGELILHIPVVARPDNQTWFRVHPDFEFPTKAISVGRKDYHLVSLLVQPALDRFLVPVVVHLIMARPDELKIWVRREKGPEDNDNLWWTSAKTIAKEAKWRWVQIQAGSDHYLPHTPEGVLRASVGVFILKRSRSGRSLFLRAR